MNQNKQNDSQTSQERPGPNDDPNSTLPFNSAILQGLCLFLVLFLILTIRNFHIDFLVAILQANEGTRAVIDIIIKINNHFLDKLDVRVTSLLLFVRRFHYNIRCWILFNLGRRIQLHWER
jgi:hypothetical protein